MAVIHRLYERLRGLEDASVDLALAGALPTAEPTALRLIALLLLERGHAQSLRGLVRHFDRLPQEVQTTVIRHARALYRPLREAAAEKNSPAPLHALRIIHRSGSTRLAYLIAEQLNRGAAEVRQEAASALLDMAQTVAEVLGDAVEASYLHAAVQEAVIQYRQHERQEVLLALAVLAARPMDKVDAALAEPRHAARQPLEALLEAAEHVEMREALLCLAHRPSLTQAAMRGLERAAAQGEVSDVLAHWPMLLLPDIAKAVSPLGEAANEYLTDHSAETWSAEAAIGLPQWIATLKLPLSTQLQALGQLVHHPDAATRLAALRHLMQLGDRICRREAERLGGVARAAESGELRAVQAAIEGFCLDAVVCIARPALRYLVRCHWPQLTRLLLQLVNGEQEQMRQVAGEYLAPLGFDRFWMSWPRLNGAQRVAAGRALIKLDPCLHRHLAQRLESGGDACIRALMMIRELNQGAFFEEALMALSNSEDTRIASAAVAALASVQSRQAIETLEHSLEHEDQRVRANSVEALKQLNWSHHVEQLADMAVSEDNRVRANAIDHLLELQSQEALVALRAMLADERPAHRISALWLIQKAGLIELVRLVAQRSISDPDDPVRRRAGRVIQHLIRAMDNVKPSTAA